MKQQRKPAAEADHLAVRPVQRRAGKMSRAAQIGAPTRPLGAPTRPRPVPAARPGAPRAEMNASAVDRAYGAAMGLSDMNGAPIQFRAADAASRAEQEQEQERDRPGFFGRVGRGLATGVSAVFGAVGDGYGLLLDGVHGVVDLTSRGVDALGRGVENIGLEGVGEGIQGGAQGMRGFFGLDEDGTDFTGHVEIPRDVAEDPEQTQQYSELGLPITDEAWAMQNAIDGGKLQQVYDETLLGALQESGILERLVQSGALQPDTIPASFHELDQEQFRALMDAVRSQLGSGRAFLDSLEPEERESFQEEVIRRYMEMAQRDEDATFLLELMPTDTAGSMPGELGGMTGDAMIRGQAPHTFRVGQTVGKIRQGAVNMADVMREQGDSVYALPVPYANVRSNIIARNGVPTDGADNMHMYMQHLGPDMRVVGTGYSQGGAAMLDYVDRYGAEDDLDQAVVLAPMGGADRAGADGVFTGERNGVEMLTVMNAGDPAKEIHGKNLFELVGPMLNFVAKPGKQRGDGSLHSGFFGDPDHALPPGIGAQEAMAAGTLGYPSHRIRPMLEELFSGEYQGTEYQRQGDWALDLRDEQPWALEQWKDGDPLPNGASAVIDVEVVMAALSRDNALASALEAIGFPAQDEAGRRQTAEALATDIQRGVVEVAAVRVDGRGFRVSLAITGPSGSASVDTSWRFDADGILPALAAVAAQR